MPGGGIGVFIKTMAETLSANGVDAWVIGYGQKRHEPFLQNGVKIKWIYLPYLLYKKSIIGGYPYTVASLINRYYLSLCTNSLIRKEKIDIIESHDFSGPLANKPLCKFVVRLHGSVVVYRDGEGRPGQMAPLDRYHEINQVKMADQLIAVSDFIGKNTNRVMNLNRPYKVIYNGVDLDTFLPLNIPPPQEKEILFVGNIIWRKGVFELIQSIPFVMNRHPEARLTIVGGASGEHRVRLENELMALSPHVRNHITIVGKVPHDQLPYYYNRASVVVFPSHVEAFGLTCAEAMACGRPVVATTLASGPELVEDRLSGLLADPKNPLDLAEKISDLLEDKKLAAAVGIRARQRAIALFDLRKLVNNNLDFYQSVKT